MKWPAVFFFTLLGFTASAQSTGELLSQIAELKIYISTVEKGYKIVEDGIHTVRDIKNGEFSLHSLFYGSLKSVNPTLSRLVTTDQSLQGALTLTSALPSILNTWKGSAYLRPSELDYVSRFIDRVVTLMSNYLTSYQTILTDNAFQMDDGQRISKMQAIDRDMDALTKATLAFIDQVNGLIAARAASIADFQTTQQILK